MIRSTLLICLYQANILDKVNREEQDMGPSGWTFHEAA
jgi:hypothetical protein